MRYEIQPASNTLRTHFNINLLFRKIMQITRENIFLSVLNQQSLESDELLPPVSSGTSINPGIYQRNILPLSERNVSEELQSSIAPTKTALSHKPGLLSAHFESGNKGSVDAIGYDPVGGTSYGIYQISSRQGSINEFIKFLEKERPEWAQRLKNAGPANTGSTKGAFPKAWKAIARENPKEFERLQHEFIRIKYFEPLCSYLDNKLGLKVKDAHPAIQEAIWSTVVQHGVSGAGKIIEQAYLQSGKKLSEGFIKNLYTLRASRFGSSPSKIRQSVLNRFEEEKKIILASLNGKNGGLIELTA